MTDFWNIAKPIVEAGVLGALLILIIRLWMVANKEVRATMELRVQAEKDHGKEILRISTEYNKQLAEMTRQYDLTLTSVNATLTAMAESRN
jgi:hypothetical protein